MRLRERALVFLGVCLPVPVFAATGLSVPLPATVERMAAVLVPFSDVMPVGDAAVQTRGVIVLTQAERRRLLIVTPAAPTAVRVEVQTPTQQFERRKAVVSPRRLAVREGTKTKPPRTRPPAQPEAGPPPAAAPTGPIGDEPEPGAEKPRPAPPPRPQPQPRPKPDQEAKPKPKPKPKPDQEQPKPKEPKEPKPKPDPKPEPPPEPDTSPAEDEDTAEQDTGARDGKPDQARVSSSPDGR